MICQVVLWEFVLCGMNTYARGMWLYGFFLAVVLGSCEGGILL